MAKPSRLLCRRLKMNWVMTSITKCSTVKTGLANTVSASILLASRKRLHLTGVSLIWGLVAILLRRFLRTARIIDTFCQISYGTICVLIRESIKRLAMDLDIAQWAPTTPRVPFLRDIIRTVAKSLFLVARESTLASSLRVNAQGSRAFPINSSFRCLIRRHIINSETPLPFPQCGRSPS